MRTKLSDFVGNKPLQMNFYAFAAQIARRDRNV